MDNIFEIEDKTGRMIRLSDMGFRHIAAYHPNIVNNLELVKDALVSPLIIIDNKEEEGRKLYYKMIKKDAKYLMVVVKYLNNHGYVITSFYVRSIKNER